MANPSLKNGYISVANELVEKFATVNIPGNEMRLIWVIWRKTWGWSDGSRKKDWDWIAFSQLVKNTGMKDGSVGKSMRSILAKRLVIKGENGYKFNQNYEEWLLAKRLVTSQKASNASQKASKTLAKRLLTKETKETNKKKHTSEQSSQELFDFNDYLERMENHNSRHIQVIAFYFKKKGIRFNNLKEAQSGIRRHLRSAKEVANFTDEAIVKSYKVAEREYPSIYTCETLLKILTR